MAKKVKKMALGGSPMMNALRSPSAKQGLNNLVKNVSNPINKPMRGSPLISALSSPSAQKGISNLVKNVSKPIGSVMKKGGPTKKSNW